MKIIEKPEEAFAHVDHWRREGLQIGLIPTMGALHQGHLSLVNRSVAERDVTVATIFVNPTQFGPNEDLSRYPRTLADDFDGLRAAQCDLVFVPQPESIYPPGFSTYIDPPAVAEPLEGVCRPGHFRGVATVVLKLFQVVPAHVAYFGQKDFQQVLVVRRMVEDLNVPIRIEACETLREPDGLAMSSRNRYLNVEQRQSALSLWKSLAVAKQMFDEGIRDVHKLELAMKESLFTSGAERIDYARVVSADSLETLELIENQSVVALIAAYVGNTRLIDNLVLN